MKWFILVLVCIAGIINFADKAVAGLAADSIMEEFNLGFTEWGLVGSSFFWFFSIGGIIGSALADRYGTKIVLGVLASIWAVAQIAPLFITDFHSLIISRVLLGLGEGPFFAVAIYHLSKWFPAEQRGMTTSVLSIGNKFGYTLLAPVIIFIIAGSGWRMGFSTLGFAGLAWLLVWMIFTKEIPNDSIIDKKSQVNSNNRQKGNWKELRKAMLSTTFIMSSILCFTTYWILIFNLNFLPTYITTVKGFSDVSMGKIIAISGLVSAVFMFLFAFISDKLYQKSRNLRKSRVFIVGFSAIMAGVIFSTMSYIATLPMLIIWIGLINAFVTIPNFLTPHYTYILLPKRAGLLLGVSVSIATSAGIFSPLVMGKIIEETSGGVASGFQNAMLLSSIIIVILGILLIIFVKPDKLADKIQQQQESSVDTYPKENAEPNLS